MFREKHSPDTPPRAKPRARWRTGLARASLLLGLGLLFTAGVLITEAFLGAPSVDDLAQRVPPKTSYMRQAVLEGRLGDDVAMQWVPLDRIPPRVACAVVMAEDPLFFRHEGFNPSLMLSALVARLRGQTVGSSTLSQQLARNLFLGSEPTLSRKLREAVITIRLERTLEKRRILELYLNVAEWGPGVWGLAPASQYYWGKTPAQLTVSEAVFLASLLPAPSRSLSGANLERAAFIQRIVLDVLHGGTVIDAAEWRHSRKRLEAAYRALRAGRPLREALAMPIDEALTLPPGPNTSEPDMPDLKPAPPLPEEHLLDEQCGLSRAEAHFGPFS
ncbi:monofunctional biosynthetic peptidoglycan transglycosylase [Corallococcus sp. CA053C]|uniref:biosynthetic peptidoglycan transglycosylase n=1 Tax=Corallococcus sp. CA053C TaxID=2316732 RepID=UPI000EA27DCA|nr:biosynthetic peptidoglycan transglycosylase [Corallococcus sp. CA053C]RKH12564.1 monofunctional biosynthetic peptidoglycan transglycosylase [Corallococcus sp. CA053C]